MGFLEAAPLPTCLSNQQCSQWARLYLKYCLCGAKDGIALFLGAVSIISWLIAELPQIITNYREKSTEGFSVVFLIAWIFGDILNLIGCLLDPATLPTQFYVALLYTVATAILTGQTVYYGHFYQIHKANKSSVPDKSQKRHQEEASAKEYLLGGAKKTRVSYHANGANPSKEGNIPSSPIPVRDSRGRSFYYTPARSLSKSPVPIFGSWLAHSCASGRSPPTNSNQQSAAREPLLDRRVLAQSAPPNLDTKHILSVVPSAAFFLGIFVLHSCINYAPSPSHDGMVILVGRKLLQGKVQDDGMSRLGTSLGWLMAAIYMGGRLPQICLNIRRGDVQGLNPLMFIFAVIGNATYVASILVKSLDWSKIRLNLPWLVDAGGCVILDVFILIQFVYFYVRKHKSVSKENPA